MLFRILKLVFIFIAAAGIVFSAKAQTAVVYFSKTGTTQSVAEAVKHFTNADLFKIETIDSYPEDLKETQAIVKKEMSEGFVRPIKVVDIDLNKYEIIVLASPVWFGHIASPLRSWIKSVKLDGKRILTAVTFGGGGEMETRHDFEELLKNSELGSQLSISGSVGEGSSAVKAWLSENKAL